ncbi:hypothetical protein [Methylomonas sp. AM2-LC]|uniref:hypothetical protein n=1 Tax=Methylomonas sp. AM2-LC TaxID=3153301 RepID=UPI003266AEF6
MVKSDVDFDYKFLEWLHQVWKRTGFNRLRSYLHKQSVCFALQVTCQDEAVQSAAFLVHQVFEILLLPLDFVTCLAEHIINIFDSFRIIALGLRRLVLSLCGGYQ